MASITDWQGRKPYVEVTKERIGWSLTSVQFHDDRPEDGLPLEAGWRLTRAGAERKAKRMLQAHVERTAGPSFKVGLPDMVRR